MANFTYDGKTYSESEIEQMRSQIAQLRTDISTYENNKNGYKKQLAEFKSKKASSTDAVETAELDAKITSIEAEIGRVDEIIASYRAKIGKWQPIVSAYDKFTAKTNSSSSERDNINGSLQQNDTSSDSSASSPTDAVSGTSSSMNRSSADSNNNINTSQGSVSDNAANLGSGSGLDYNTVKNKGVVYPIIRINDHYFSSYEIEEFSIETGFYKNYHDWKKYKFPKTGFVPTMRLVITTTASDLLKRNIIKSGDKCAVFFSSGGGIIKSYRADYLITSVVTSDKETEITDNPVTFIITGELFIPNLRNETEKFNFNGSSRDAMMDCATRLGLAFYFCDPDDTQDYQGWICSKNLHDYALEVSSHAWKEFNAFFDAWIDPRYGLSFININKMLVEDGLDEPIDLTPFINMMNRSVGIDGNKATSSEEYKKEHPQPQAKILTNITKDDESITPFYIQKWNIVNKASEIANEIGVNTKDALTIDNPGISSENSDIDMEYSIPTNKTKLQNGFYVLIGPGVNLTYTQADQKDPNMSFVKKSYTVKGGGIVETMSSGDADMMKQTGNNMYSSGNTNRFYDAGWEHNMRNNLQLQKQYLEVELSGLNLRIMRGEKIPVLILDHDKVQSSARANNYASNILESTLYETASGWYIIDGLMYEWKSNNNEGPSNWCTKLKLVRREWPIPGRVSTATVDNKTVTFQTTVDATENNAQLASSTGYMLPDIVITPESQSSSVSGLDSNTQYASDGGLLDEVVISATAPRRANDTATGTDAKQALSVSEEDITSAEEVPLTGLKSSLKTVYSMIKSICPNIRLVSARRWAVDLDGKRTEGNAFVTRSGMYKCVNAKGQVMYFKSNNSKHLYGEAFDIINGPGQDFNSIMSKYVMMNNQLLQEMALSGIGACIEQTTDDSGVATKHYHFGTDKNILKPFWDAVRALNKNLDSVTSAAISNYISYNTRNAASEIKKTEISEI